MSETVHTEKNEQPGSGFDRWLEASRPLLPVTILVIVLSIFFSLTQENFASKLNIENLLIAVSLLWVVAMGETFCLLSGGADLSAGALAALSGLVFYKLNNLGLPGGLALAGTLVFGGLVGAGLNGVLIGVLGLSFFVVTLATLIALTGVVVLWSNSVSFIVDAPVITSIGAGTILTVPTPICIMAVVFLIFWYIQRQTYFGRDVYAVGGNVTAARLSGIRTARTALGVYGLMGVCAALAGIIAVALVGSASPQVNNNLPLQAIAAVLLGGTALFGGAGTVVGTALGVLFIGILENGLSLSGVPDAWQQIVTGVILVTAVLVDRPRSGQGRVARLINELRRSTVPKPAPAHTANLEEHRGEAD